MAKNNKSEILDSVFIARGQTFPRSLIRLLSHAYYFWSFAQQGESCGLVCTSMTQNLLYYIQRLLRAEIMYSSILLYLGCASHQLGKYKIFHRCIEELKNNKNLFDSIN